MGLKQTIKLTGHRGFIGSSVMLFLQKQGYEIEQFDGNLLNKEQVHKFMSEGKASTLIHMAGSFDPPMEHLIESNVTTTANLLSEIPHSKVKKVIYLSSAAVYGEPQKEQSVESDLLYPNTEYGKSKQLAEEQIITSAKSNGIHYVILRFPGVYGGTGGKGVIQRFLVGIKDHQKIVLFGDGTQKRSFLHIADAGNAILAACRYNKSGIFNICSTKSISLNEIIKLLRTKYDFDVVHENANNNLKDISLDISCAQSELGYHPKHTSIEL